MAHSVRGWVIYTCTNTAQYGATCNIKADIDTAVNNGATLNPSPTSGVLFFPAHRSNLRYVRGVDSTAPQYKDTCLAVSTTVPIYAFGALFIDAQDNAYTVNGLHSETLSLRNMK